jgi:hypothetical protein
MTPGRAHGFDDEVLQWVERAATFLADRWGVALLTGQALSWLMICDPPEQSTEQIAGAIGADPQTLAPSLEFLTAAGFALRSPQPADGPRVRYLLDDDAWMRVLRRRVGALVPFRDLAQDGVQLIGPADPRSNRMRAARDSLDWLDAVIIDAEQQLPSGWQTTDGKGDG